MKCKLFITIVYLNLCLIQHTNDDNDNDRVVLKYLSTNVEWTKCKKKKQQQQWDC